MTAGRFAFLPLDERDRTGFVSASEPLTRYFHSQAGQDIRRRAAACIIAVHGPSAAIAGFYTLSAAQIPLTDLPPEMVRRAPRYPVLPAARLGRLAVDRRFAGQGLGAALVADAVLRAAASEVAVFAMIVEAKDAAAEAFWRHHGFSAYASVPGRLMAPITSLLPKVRDPIPE